MAESTPEVIEGFLCPVCMRNLRTQEQLLAHFQESHEDDQDVLKSLKELLGKAKKKIGLVQGEDFPIGFQSPSSTPNLKQQTHALTGEKQELGATRSHTERLRVLRSARHEQYCAETNKLIIRLDKLLVDVPNDSNKRRVHEQNIVCWVEDTYVKLCPSCARSFHMARRKHHCRLCGGIMCHDCSYFLTVADARRMTAATSLEEPTSVKRSSSTQSLNAGPSESDFRLCEHCHRCLSLREQLKESRMSRPIISQFYDKLQSHRNEASVLLAEYHKMYFSLCSGESLYHLSDAQHVRVKLIKIAEAIDNTSKAILVLGTRGGESSAPQGRAMRLQQSIRSAFTHYLRDQLVGLPSLPSEAQLKELQNKRQQNMEARLSMSPAAPALMGSRPPEVMANAGWTPDNSSKLLLDSDNIMVQQMNNIRNYIKQAREAHKYDVVRTLEANLKELQEEYWRQQNQSQ